MEEDLEIQHLEYDKLDEIAHFFSHVFEKESYFARNMSLNRRDLEQIYATLLELFFSDPENLPLGFCSGENLISAGIFSKPGWSPNFFSSLGGQLSLFAKLGVKKSMSILRLMFDPTNFYVDGYWHLLLLATDEKFRNMGLAKNIISEFFSKAVEKSEPKLYIEVLNTSPAKTFYRKMGFEQLRPVTGKSLFCPMVLSNIAACDNPDYLAQNY